MEENNWIDISQTLSTDIAVWPGDPPYNFELMYTKKATGSANVGQMAASVHTGTHIDAPYHFNNDGKQVHELAIHTYIGEAMLIDVTSVNVITANVLAGFDITGVKRLLLKTEKHRDETVFPEHFTVIDPDVGPYLRKKGVFLLGTDAPSVDSVDSKTLDAHHSLQENGIHIVENLLLNDVAPGDYELIALPLKIAGADGSPIRAVIRPV